MDAKVAKVALNGVVLEVAVAAVKLKRLVDDIEALGLCESRFKGEERRTWSVAKRLAMATRGVAFSALASRAEAALRTMRREAWS